MLNTNNQSSFTLRDMQINTKIMIQDNHDLNDHLESYHPGQDMAKQYIRV
jgi:hypothetical protein